MNGDLFASAFHFDKYHQHANLPTSLVSKPFQHADGHTPKVAHTFCIAIITNTAIFLNNKFYIGIDTKTQKKKKKKYTSLTHRHYLSKTPKKDTHFYTFYNSPKTNTTNTKHK